MIEGSRSDHHNNSSKGEKHNIPNKKEIIIIPKFLMKFSSTYFKRASENIISAAVAAKTEKQMEKIIENPGEEEERKSYIPKFERKHGRSISEADFDKLPKDRKMMSGGSSSIYDLINYRMTDHTQNNQTHVTNENCIITIGTDIDEDSGKPKTRPRVFPYPVEIINFLHSKESQKNVLDHNIQIFHEDEFKKNLTDRQYNKSNVGVKIFNNQINEKNQSEFGFINNRSKSLENTSLHEEKKLIQSPTLNTMHVAYSPSNHRDVKKVDEVKPLENLDRSVVNCLICFDKTPDAVFMECGHGGKIKIKYI